MNIDDLKSAWGNDEPSGMHLPDSTFMMGKTTSVVEKVRKKMKSEFVAALAWYFLLIAYIIFIRVTFYKTGQAIFFLNTVSLLLFILLLLNAYFFGKFYIFYKSMSRYDLGVSESVRKIAYELELNTEIYKTYTLAVAPLSVLITFTLVGGKTVYDYLFRLLSTSAFTSAGMMWLFSTIAVSFVIIWYCVNLHIRTQYGKYLAELKQIGDDLGSER
jgi:hypothetical protein